LDIKNSTQHELYIQIFYGPDKIIKEPNINVGSGYDISIWVDCCKEDITLVYPDMVGIDSIHFNAGPFSQGYKQSTKGKNPFEEKFWTQTTTKRTGGGLYTSSTFEITDKDLEKWGGL
jgi:hypothetical protein